MIKIYGKDNCGYCNMSKTLCETRGVEYEYLQLDKDYSMSDFQEKFPSARTFPQILMNNESIGGFNELRDKL